MASNINTAIPPLGSPTTAGVRANFAAAKAEIEALQTNHGFVNYQDTATQTTPIALAANTWVKLTNDKLGSRTKTDRLPSGVTNLWNSATNQFTFSELPVDTTLDGRFDLEIVTTANNTTVDISAYIAIGSASAFEFPLITSSTFKTAGTYKLNVFNSLFIPNTDIKGYPTEIKVRADATSSIKVHNFYIRMVKPI